MKGAMDSVMGVIKDRLVDPVYGTFFVLWGILHWKFLYTMFFVDEKIILSKTGQLKSDYLSSTFFNTEDIYFWVFSILPFMLTYVFIWHLPKWVLAKAYREHLAHKANNEIAKISQEKIIEEKRAELARETVKKEKAVEEQKDIEKRIKEIDPTLGWGEEFEHLKGTRLYQNLDYIVKSIYEHDGFIKKEKMNGLGQIYTIFEVPNDIIAYSHTNGLLLFTNKHKQIDLTDKGKYFIKRYIEEKK